MSTLTKRATIYFDPEIHRALKVKAAETASTLSEIVNELVRNELLEDESDLQVFADRANEPTVTYESLLKELKKSGKI